jgi:hypothetical protein
LRGKEKRKSERDERCEARSRSEIGKCGRRDLAEAKRYEKRREPARDVRAGRAKRELWYDERYPTDTIPTPATTQQPNNNNSSIPLQRKQEDI